MTYWQATFRNFKQMLNNPGWFALLLIFGFLVCFMFAVIVYMFSMMLIGGF